MGDEYDEANFAKLINFEALANFKGKSLLSSYSYLDMLAREHAVAFSVAKMLDEDMLSETQDAITAALANGTDFNDFKKRLTPYLMSRGWWGEQVMTDPVTGERKAVQLGSTRRLRTIYHTNLHSSYAAGQWQRIQDTKAALPYLQYMPSVAGRKRDEHKRYYGIIRPVDDPIWQRIMPPNGYGCLCWVKQLTRAQAERAGISDEVELDEVETENPRTGDKIKSPKGVDPSFDHNHDRLTAIRSLYSEKAQTWSHVPKAKHAAKAEQYELDLDNYMQAVLDTPLLKPMTPHINTEQFAERLTALSKMSAADIAKADRQWAVASMSASVQDQLGIDNVIAWLPERLLGDMVGKMALDDVRALLASTSDMLGSIEQISKSGGQYVITYTSDKGLHKMTLAVDSELKTLNIIELVRM